MSNNIESAILLLRTCDLSTSANACGSKDLFNIGPFTWRNINLKTLLGNMYEKYDLFNLTLLQISNSGTSIPISSNQNYLSADSNNNTVVVRMSGLPFINNTYDTKTQHNTNVTTLCNYQFGSIVGVAKTGTTSLLCPFPSYTQYQTCQSNTFGKSQVQADIIISYRRINDNAILTVDGISDPTTALFPDAQFLFSITGIPKDEDNINSSRLSVDDPSRNRLKIGQFN